MEYNRFLKQLASPEAGVIAKELRANRSACFQAFIEAGGDMAKTTRAIVARRLSTELRASHTLCTMKRRQIKERLGYDDAKVDEVGARNPRGGRALRSRDSCPHFRPAFHSPRPRATKDRKSVV